MKIGILSDIHGDLKSLTKALDVFARQDVELILCAGDVVEKGDDDDGVVAKLRQLEIGCVQGNHDANAVKHHDFSTTVQVPGEVPLKRETISYLRELPSTLGREIAGNTLLVAHGTPSQDAGRVFHDQGPPRLSKRFKKDLARTDSKFVIVGHTHFPFDLHYRDKRILNPGATCCLKARDSHTVGVLNMCSEAFKVYSLHDGQEIEILCSKSS